MENKKRVFAYTLAKKIDDAALAEVSGGGAPWTTKQTVQVTGSQGLGMDVAYDVALDW